MKQRLGLLIDIIFPVKSIGKLTLKQTMETLVHALQSFDERLQKLETVQSKKFEEIETRIFQMENQMSNLPSMIHQLCASTINGSLTLNTCNNMESGTSQEISQSSDLNFSEILQYLEPNNDLMIDNLIQSNL